MYLTRGCREVIRATLMAHGHASRDADFGELFTLPNQEFDELVTRLPSDASLIRNGVPCIRTGRYWIRREDPIETFLDDIWEEKLKEAS